METERYADAVARWPRNGRHILAQHDDESLLVYQAFNPDIARSAVADQRLGGGGFSFGRMSWVKPNFLWMMYRSGWATKENQERILALRLPRRRFEALLGIAVASSHGASHLTDVDQWRIELAASEVRLQWDPDHAPDGSPCERRAVQIGLRGDTLREFAHEWITEVIDVTPFVESQRALVASPALLVPVEYVLVLPVAIAMRAGAAANPAEDRRWREGR